MTTELEKISEIVTYNGTPYLRALLKNNPFLGMSIKELSMCQKAYSRNIESTFSKEEFDALSPYNKNELVESQDSARMLLMILRMAFFEVRYKPLKVGEVKETIEMVGDYYKQISNIEKGCCFKKPRVNAIANEINR